VRCGAAAVRACVIMHCACVSLHAGIVCCVVGGFYVFLWCYWGVWLSQLEGRLLLPAAGAARKEEA